MSLARTARRRLCEFKDQERVNIAWASARARELDAQLFIALGRMAERRMAEFNAQSLANTAWSLTESVACDAEFL